MTYAPEARDLYARAEMAAETGDLAALAASILRGAEQAGADPEAVAGIIAAIRRLDPAMAVRYDAGNSSDRRVNTGPYRTEGEFLEAVSDAEDQVTGRQREVAGLQDAVSVTMDGASSVLAAARADLAAARAALPAALAMSVKERCDGCHGAKQAAIAAAEALIADAEERITDAGTALGTCEAAEEILTPLADAVAVVLGCIRRVPQDLGEVYELVHRYIRNGGKLPDPARWIEGMTRYGAA